MKENKKYLYMSPGNYKEMKELLLPKECLFTREISFIDEETKDESITTIAPKLVIERKLS